MEEFARAQRAEGLRLQEQHHSRDGICVTCGRTSPCDSHRRGVDMVTRYSGFLTAEPDQEPPPNLVRPYALAGGRLNRGRW